MSERIYRVNELVSHSDNLDLLEDVARAYVAKRDELPFKVYVAGCDNYGNGLKKYKKPHFHVIIEGENILDKIRIYIPTRNEWLSNKKLIICDFCLKNYDDVLEILSKWLDTDWQNRGIRSNLENITFTWNELNDENHGVDKI